MPFSSLRRIEIARPLPGGDGEVDGVVLRRDAHHLGAAPGDRPHIGVLLPVLLQHQALGRVDLGDRVGDLEIEHLRRALEPLGMLGALEDLAAIGALALEHAAGVVQAVGEHVHRGIAPGHELAVVPDDAVEPVVGLFRHGTSSSDLGSRCPASGAFGVPRGVASAFASRANSRYVFRHPMRACLRLRRNLRSGQGPRHDPFVPDGFG